MLEDYTILKAAIETYGIEAQAAKACEEFAELIRALARLNISVKTNCLPDDCNNAYCNVLEEIADAEIMLTQLRMIFKDGEVDRIRAAKLRRLAVRLGLAVTEMQDS